MGKNKDIIGNAIKNYFHHQDRTPITVLSPDFDDDEIPVDYLFRSFKEMPIIEQTALKLCKGKTLDVGCGSGTHSLYLQTEKKLPVFAIDTSPGAIEISKERGVNAVVADFFELKNDQFDTLLFLMNGSGIIGNLENIPKFFNQCRNLLSENGQVIMDSSDLKFLFEDPEDFSENYYGEMQYRMRYKDESTDWFEWLFIDQVLLKELAAENKFSCEIVKDGPHFDFLCVLKAL
ncbi:class I SAM-dependent methyltransferase [Gramella sp. AN32]|uniref:Class I SAM-dependent methyltransferase n=1 Tax=Christiangramia antarctica TaxID=2058158 RepID=A0ABW5X6Q4_9FLAO|nr:class I SAM-dependent methyltransferase [Gramella sp. AN32]MCM4154666.1 SAM-dependent methyltransferase [Gramella sp. AN32]